MKSVFKKLGDLLKVVFPTFEDAKLVLAPRGAAAARSAFVPKRANPAPAAVRPAPTGTPAQDKVEPVQKESSVAGASSQEATGRVVDAQVYEVGARGRGRAYQTFVVTLRTNSGHEAQFTGVDLHRAFDEGKFAVGDTVRLRKTTVPFVMKMAGKEVSRTKNEYVIDVLLKCRR